MHLLYRWPKGRTYLYRKPLIFQPKATTPKKKRNTESWADGTYIRIAQIFKGPGHQIRIPKPKRPQSSIPAANKPPQHNTHTHRSCSFPYTTCTI